MQIDGVKIHRLRWRMHEHNREKMVKNWMIWLVIDYISI